LYLLKIARDFEEEEPQRRDALPRFILAQGLVALGVELLKPAMRPRSALAELVAQGEKGSARDSAIVPARVMTRARSRDLSKMAAGGF
jgi:hypothetical protein